MCRRRLLIASLGVVLAVLLVSSPEAAVVDPAVAHRMQTLPPGGEIPVIIALSDKADLRIVSAGDRRGRRERILRSLRTKADRTQGPLLSFLAQWGGRRLVSLWIRNAIAATVPASVVERLAAFPGVESIALDDVIYAPVVVLGAPSAPEWNLSMVRAPDLWALGYRGQGVVVASMDTGVDAEHPDLLPKWRGGGNSWFDPNGQHATPFDAHGHGTFTMGIMVGGDAGGTSIGVAPDAQWIAVKIFDDSGSASYSAIHAGYQWLLDPDVDPSTDDAPDVINNSWGFDANPNQCISEFEPDIRILKESGIAVVFSAGNAGPNPSSSISPANNDGSFAVGAVDNNQIIWQFSSRGPSACGESTFPHVVAPGVSIRSADLSFGGMALYAIGGGTSAAGPHVAAGMALLSEAFPNMFPSKLEWAMAASAADLAEPGIDNVYGYGLIDLLSAYQMVGTPGAAGVYIDGRWYLDSDGDGVWSGAPTDMFHPNFGGGLDGAVPVTGDWTGTGMTRVGIYHNGRWYFDLNGNGAWEGTPTDGFFPIFGGMAGAVPVTGDWTGTGTTRIGVYHNGVWYLDLNGNGTWDGTPTDTFYANFGVGLVGAVPVTGDWIGTGTTRIGVYHNGVWYLDLNGNGAWDGIPTDTFYANFGVGLVGAVPVTGDWTGTGSTKVSVYHHGIWYLDLNGNGVWDGQPDDVFYANFGGGLDGAVPVSGRW